MSKPRLRISGAMPIDMKNHFRNATEFYANYLMTPQMVKNLNIHVKYKNELDAGTYGECEILNEGINPRHFKITITPKMDTFKNRVITFQTLAHEMIHVKQFAYKELKYVIKSMERTKWKGRCFNEKKMRYEKLPWEKEAFRKEDIVFAEYVVYSESFDYFFG